MLAKARRFEGVVADRCVNIGGLAENIVDSAGADELGWLNRVFSGTGVLVLPSEDLGDSERGLVVSKDNGGRKVDICEEELCGCLWMPSM